MAHTHRVLIVEDDYGFRWSLAMRCQRREIDADVAETIGEAHELIRRPSDYCGVMLDLRMGQSDGAALLDTIAERSQRPNVVVITGYPDVWERVRASEQASLVNKTFFKPADVDTVIDATVGHCV
jgi:ActR/RegA family two-component response regulator